MFAVHDDGGGGDDDHDDVVVVVVVAITAFVAIVVVFAHGQQFRVLLLLFPYNLPSHPAFKTILNVKQLFCLFVAKDYHYFIYLFIFF